MTTNQPATLSPIVALNNNPNEIYLLDEIYQSTVSAVIKQINEININNDKKEKEFIADGNVFNRKPIELYVSSYGGSVYDGLGLIGVMQSSKTPVNVIATGKVMSMGLLITCAAHKAFAYPHTTFMYHALSSWAAGQLQDLKEQYEECVRLQKVLDAIVTNNTGISQARLTEYQGTKTNWFFDTEVALALGVIEGVV